MIYNIIENIGDSMKKTITIENLNNEPFTLEEKDIICVMGKNGVGKSTFLKEIKEAIKNNYKVTLVTPKTKLTKEEITAIQSDTFNLSFKDNFNNMSKGEKYLLVLLSNLEKELDVLLIDHIMDLLDNVTKERIFKLLKTKSKDTIILYTTSFENDLLHSNKCLFIKEEKREIFETKEILKDEKKFKEYKIAYPFMADLSKKLSYYSLLTEPIYDIDKMVKKLWK
jgi:ABC-type cobalamin/Fe3+-siderophores transport system ATPase subunit